MNQEAIDALKEIARSLRNIENALKKSNTLERQTKREKEHYTNLFFNDIQEKIRDGEKIPDIFTLTEIADKKYGISIKPIEIEKWMNLQKKKCRT